MKFTRLLLTLGLLVLCSQGLAQYESEEAKSKGFNTLTQSGKILQFKMQSDAKTMTFVFTGNDVAKAKITDEGVEASFDLGGVTKSVKLERVGNANSLRYRLRRADVPVEKFKLKVKSSAGEEIFDVSRP